ncbi:MAG: 50S ribosomal protein L7/L12 [Candidatus Caldatribacteriota bacterium]|nr:50S ribosomal protein L7/L12 [Candidatus Caldatribacteriota bacterium]
MVEKKEEKKEVKKEVKKETKKVEPKKESKVENTVSNEILEKVEKMTVLELSELVKALEEKFGVSAAMPMAAPTAGGAGTEEAKEAEEKTSFDVVLKEIGANKIKVIKEIRTITALGLKESKDLVEGAPNTVKEHADKKEADEIKVKLEAVGAVVEIK